MEIQKQQDFLYQTINHCQSKDGTYIYATSKDFNELVIYSVVERKIIKRIRIEDEKDCADLFMHIICFENYLFLMPRKAKHFHLYDLDTNKQLTIDQVEIAPDFKIHPVGLFGCEMEDKVFLINRNPLRIFEFLIKKKKFIERTDRTLNPVRVVYYEVVVSDIYLYCDYDRKIFVFHTQDNSLSSILIPEHVPNYKGVRYYNHSFYFYSGSIVYVYNERFEQTKKIQVTSPIFLTRDNKDLYAVSQDGSCYFELSKKFEKKEIKGFREDRIYSFKHVCGTNRQGILLLDEIDKDATEFRVRTVALDLQTQTLNSAGIILDDTEVSEYRKRAGICIKENMKNNSLRENENFGLREYLEVFVKY